MAEVQTSFTREQLITKVLEKLRRITEGNPGTPWERDVVDSVIDASVEELRTKGVVSLDITGDMPIKYLNWLSIYVKAGCAGEFGMPVEYDERALAEAQLRYLAGPGVTYEPQHVDPMMDYATPYGADGFYGGYRRA